MKLSQFFLAAATAIASPISINDTTPTFVGPENGHLVIVGGNLQSESIWQRIISLAGGPDAPIVVVPTAGGEPTYGANFSSAVTLRKLGATNVTVLHTYDPAVADTDEFIAPLLAAKGFSLAEADSGDSSTLMPARKPKLHFKLFSIVEV
jgi:cyanophycinase-like exopeptidase